MVVVVVSREFLITGLRSYLESQGVRFGADWLGKFKMGLQCAAVVAIFVALQQPRTLFNLLRDVLVYAMLAATILSGLQYVWRAAGILRAEQEKTAL
jgi:CDP-diacylglycerol--glycerol-3-phosphate 3-phosphatidyltransferase